MKKNIHIGKSMSVCTVSGKKITGTIVKILENTIVMETDTGILELIRKKDLDKNFHYNHEK